MTNLSADILPTDQEPRPARCASPGVIGVREMRERFGLGPRRARALMRRMRHLADGRELWTTDAWLAEWCAAQVIPGSDWPATDRTREPMDQDVVDRAIELIGALAQRGAISVGPLEFCS